MPEKVFRHRPNNLIETLDLVQGADADYTIDKSTG
jgi:hypothetical protein